MNAAAPVLKLRVLDASAPAFDADLARLVAFETAQDAQVDAAVAAIVDDVRVRGDVALLEYTKRFDRLDVDRAAALEIAAADMRDALERLPADQRDALAQAAARIRAFHENQRTAAFSVH